LDRVLLKAIDQLGQKRSICRGILLGLRGGFTPEDLGRWLRLTRSQIDDKVYQCRQALRRILAKDYGLHI
jgi:hypothetical protein